MSGVHAILCVNAGSSTLKCARYEVSADGAVAAVDTAEGPAGPDAFTGILRRWKQPPDVVAHRIVHGGPDLDEHTVIDPSVLDRLRAAISFAPLHLPSEIDAIDAARQLHPDAVQVACFDTTFHKTMPAVARRLPLPDELDAAGVHRFGFHGLSCEYVVDALTPQGLGHAIIAHLGSGASLTAIRDGRSVDTTMGMTPAGGVVMATRTGDLDPGVLIHLLRHGYDADELEVLVTRRSGLLGLSGTTNDMRELLERRSRGDDAAALAVDSFCTSVRKQIGALTAVLGRLDTIVFTGGIGENAAAVRAGIGENLGHLGISIDAARNDRHDAIVSTSATGVTVRVLRTDENLAMARHAVRLATR